MKYLTLKNLGSLATAFITTMLLWGCSSTPKTVYFDNGVTAVIESLSGDVEVAAYNGDWRNASVGTTVQAGDRIRTGNDGSARLNLGKYGGTAELLPNSSVQITRLGTTRQEPKLLAVLSLEQGRIIGDTKNPPKNGRVLIRTPKGTYEIH
jgi:hypothetical protein